MNKKFNLGAIVATAGVYDFCDPEHSPDNWDALHECLRRHAHGDWGLVDQEDWVTNDNAVIQGDRILSAYEIDGTNIWVITEWDRSVTTVLLPSEY